MAERTPTLDEWLRLYQAAIRVKEIAPWEWMRETDLFGVQNPETGEIGFVSLMGMLGQHFAVAVYLGPRGLDGFWGLQEPEPFAPPEGLFEVPHLQASFEDRNELSDKDRDVIKKLGLRFRGRHAWPMFRSYRPGFFPWHVEPQEARFLTYALEQTLDVSLRVREDPDMLMPSDDGYLVRVSREGKAGLVWKDRIVTVLSPSPEPISVTMDADMLDELKELPLSQCCLEMDFFMVPVLIEEERGSRPQFPYMLLVVDADSGFILGNELLPPQPSLEARWGLVPAIVVRQLARAGIVPRQISVRTSLLFQLLQPLAEELGFDVKQAATLEGLDPAKAFLLQRFV